MKKLVIPVLLMLVIGVGCAPGSCIPSTTAVSHFEADPSSVSAGQPSTLKWKVVGATTVSIDQGIGNVALTGSREVTPSATTVYTLTATNALGASTTATAQVIVTGAPSPPAGLPVVSSFAASPSSIPAGNWATLSWNVSNATSVAIDQGIGAVASSGTTSVSPVATTTYTLTATNAAGSTTAMTDVIVSGAPPVVGLPIINFTASPSIIPFGGSTTLSWSVTNATSVTIDQGVGAVGSVGTTIVSPATSTNYTLTASNAAGWSTQMISVLVTGGPPSGLPDLVIEDISRSGDKISYKIKNQGSAVAGPSTSTLRVDGIVAANDGVDPLSPGASRTETFTGYVYSCTLPGDSLEVRADTGGAVTEGSEANNSFSKSWSCLLLKVPLEIAKPDLIVQDIWRSGGKFYYRVKNQGSGGSAACTAQLWINSTLRDSDAVPALAAGASTDQMFAYLFVPPFICVQDQTYTIEVRVDTGNTNTESNEGNNTRTESFVCVVKARAEFLVAQSGSFR